jgi:PhnB protein
MASGICLVFFSTLFCHVYLLHFPAIHGNLVKSFTMTQANIYLNFDGNAREAFEFYHSIFGGDPPVFMTFADADPEGRGPAEERDRIMHTAIKIGNTLLMASDISPAMGHKLNVGNNYYISLNVDSREEADRVFSALKEGGVVEQEMQDMFWGDYWGCTKDKYGVQWMISYTFRQENQP